MEREEQTQEADRAEADQDAETPEFNPEDIEQDPAYNPGDREHLKDQKGG
jgi:hypothetical protein